MGKYMTATPEWIEECELCTVPNLWLLSQQNAAGFWFENRGWAMLGQYCLHNELAAEFHHILKYSDSPVIRQRPEILIAGRKDSEKSGHGNSPR